MNRLSLHKGAMLVFFVYSPNLSAIFGLPGQSLYFNYAIWLIANLLSSKLFLFFPLVLYIKTTVSSQNELNVKR